ncbi:hypothetical protein AN963_02720 [Brevibacillus choshinensis]|uniref:Spore coat protein n=1 Tax=Brevibacillus choshinensis TaxID=54911 RepID=A0ABR5NB06_BRECH|nr:hypothetical protein [Brevibacillus choshinensis]KQL48730.1 hypothetical protein AN963_02720 [Brevibacillus choshinensis]
MDDYMLNYYSLMIDFIEEFKTVQYKGIPLALFLNLYNLMGHENPLLTDKSFRYQLKNQVNNPYEIQQRLDAIMDPIMSNTNKHANGKVMLYDYVLGNDTFLHYLDPSRVFACTSGDVEEKMKNYMGDTSSIWSELSAESGKLLDQMKAHPIYSEHGFKALVFDRQFPAFLHCLYYIEKFFDEVPISCLFVGTTTDAFSRILCVAAGQKGIPSICMQHGLIGIEESFMPVYSTKVGVTGNYEREWYRNRGVPEHRIAITGHPKFDWIFYEPRMPLATFQQIHGLDPRKKSILIATEPGADPMLIHDFIKTVYQLSSPELLLKPHPHEFAFQTLNMYDPLFLSFPSLKLVTGMNAHDVLYNCDVTLVVEQSTIGLQGLLFNKPVLFLKNVQKQHPLYVADFFDEMGRFSSSDARFLAAAAVDLISPHSVFYHEYHNKRNEFVSSRYPTKASMRAILELIHHLTGSWYNHPVNRPFSG